MICAYLSLEHSVKEATYTMKLKMRHLTDYRILGPKSGK